MDLVKGLANAHSLVEGSNAQTPVDGKGSPLFSLPEELWLEIFSFLTILEIGQAKQVCRSWNVCGQNDQLWKRVIERFEPNPERSSPHERGKTYQSVTRDSVRLGSFFDIRNIIHVNLEARTVEFTVRFSGEFYSIQEKIRHLLKSIVQAKQLLPSRSFLFAVTLDPIDDSKHFSFEIKGPPGTHCEGLKISHVEEISDLEKEVCFKRMVPFKDKENIGLYQEFSVLPYEFKEAEVS